MRNVIKYYCFLICCFVVSLVAAQQKESERLKEQQNALKKKISLTENLLKSTADNRKNLSNTIGLIDLKIDYRKALLANLDNQLNDILNQVKTVEKEIAVLNDQIEQQKEQYKYMLRQAYRMRNDAASLIYIISSETVNQANKRAEYLEQLSKYRQNQIKKIRASIVVFEDQKRNLHSLKDEKEKVLASKQVEQKKYVSDREKQRETILSLEGKEQQLKQELQQQRKKSEEIRRAINAAINKEIAAERKKNEKAPRSVKETKEVALNTSNFESNKGKLPWPVTAGEITKGFGKQPHPVHINVFTYNNGVDITTVKGASVRAVFAGKVTSVIIIPGAGKAVIVAHGNYRTIYSNLSETYVQPGDQIELKQEIGALLANENNNSEVHFEIRKITKEGEITNINPTYWLTR